MRTRFGTIVRPLVEAHLIALALSFGCLFSQSCEAEFFRLDVRRIEDLSADGSTVVGSLGEFGGSLSPFRWTRADGIIPLGHLDLPLGEVESAAVATSGNGSIVAGISQRTGPDPLYEPFIWTEATGLVATGLRMREPITPFVRLSNDGTALFVHSRDAFTSVRELHRWTASNGSEAFDIPATADGLGVAGTDWVSSDGSVLVGELSFLNNLGRPFRWTESRGFQILDGFDDTRGGVTDISSDARFIVGWIALDQIDRFQHEAFIWTEARGTQRLGVLPGHKHSIAASVSDDGTVVFGTSTQQDSPTPFIWSSAGGMREISLPFEPASIDILSARDGSRAVFAVRDPSRDQPNRPPKNESFVWDPENGLRSLKSLIADEIGELDLGRVIDMSDDGNTIVGEGVGPDGELASWIAFLGETLRGDFNADSQLDIGDIDLLSEQVRLATHNTDFDLNSDARVDEADRSLWVTEIANTYFGDANLDGEFNSSDLVEVFKTGQYEDALAINSGWATGDWNGDGEFTSSDLVVAFQDGGYEQGPRNASHAVPEPTGFVMLMSVGLWGWIGRRSTQTCRLGFWPIGR